MAGSPRRFRCSSWPWPPGSGAGPDHSDTLTSRNNLANAYRDAGQISEAIPLIEQMLAARERMLGADHPEPLASRNNLAVADRATRRIAARSRYWRRIWRLASGCLAPTAPELRSRETTSLSPTKRSRLSRPVLRTSSLMNSATQQRRQAEVPAWASLPQPFPSSPPPLPPSPPPPPSPPSSLSFRADTRSPGRRRPVPDRDAGTALSCASGRCRGRRGLPGRRSGRSWQRCPRRGRSCSCRTGTGP